MLGSRIRSRRSGTMPQNRRTQIIPQTTTAISEAANTAANNGAANNGTANNRTRKNSLLFKNTVRIISDGGVDFS